MHDADRSAKDLGYELSDVQIKVILWSGVGLVIMTFAAFVVSVFFIKYLAAGGSMSEYEVSPLAGENQEWDLKVRLQPNPPAALAEHREGQNYASTTYGTVSEEPEIYHIPIETAMDIVAKYGLPTFTAFLPSETQEGQ